MNPGPQVPEGPGPDAAPGWPAAHFHADSDTVRFWVEVEGQAVGASISRQTLRFGFGVPAVDDDAMKIYRAHAGELDAAVRRRVARGSIEPVMLREFDLRLPAAERP